MGSFYYVYILRDVTTGMHHYTGAGSAYAIKHF